MDDSPLSAPARPLRLPASKQLAYALGQLGWSILINVVGITLVYFYLPPDNAGIPNLITPATFLGVLNALVLIAAAGRLVDAVTDPWVASLSDRSTNPRGRRIPFMAKGAIPAAVFLALMFLPPVSGVSGWNAVWVLATSIGFYVALTFYVTPFYALLPELGHSPRERLNLATWVSITYAIGIIVAGSVTVLAEPVQSALGLDSALQAIQAVVVALAVLSLVLMAIPVVAIDERRYSAGQPSSVPFKPALRAALGDGQLRRFIFADFVYFAAITIILTGMLYYVTVLLEEDESLVATLLAVSVVVSFLLYPLVNLLARRFGKKPLVMLSFFVMAFTFGNVILLGKLPMPAVAQAFFVVIVYSVPLAFLGVLPNAMLADYCQWDARRSGERKEGLFYAARTLMQKFGQTAGVLVFAMLTTFGINIGDDLGIRLSGVVGAVLALLAAVVFAGYDERRILDELGDEVEAEAA